MNVAIILPNWVGDVIMAAPTIRALRELHPRPARLIGVAHPSILDVLGGNPWFDELIPYARDAENREHRFWPVAGKLRRERPDLAIILPNAPRHAALAWLSGARQRIGYDRRRRGFLLTTRLTPPMKDGEYIPTSTLDYYLDLARAAGCTSTSRTMTLYTTAANEAAADAVWAANDWNPAERVVAINNSGAFGSAKLWPDEYVVELAQRIVAQHRHRVLILCGPSERERAESIAALAGPGVTSLATHEPSLGLTKACLPRCRVLITTDSGPRHMGAAYGLQVVTLFGPTAEAWSETGYARERQLHFPIECRPCQQRECPLGHHRCMRDLSVDMVAEAVQKAIAETL